MNLEMMNAWTINKLQDGTVQASFSSFVLKANSVAEVMDMIMEATEKLRDTPSRATFKINAPVLVEMGHEIPAEDTMLDGYVVPPSFESVDKKDSWVQNELPFLSTKDSSDVAVMSPSDLLPFCEKEEDFKKYHPSFPFEVLKKDLDRRAQIWRQKTLTREEMAYALGMRYSVARYTAALGNFRYERGRRGPNSSPGFYQVEEVKGFYESAEYHRWRSRSRKLGMTEKKILKAYGIDDSDWIAGTFAVKCHLIKVPRHCDVMDFIRAGVLPPPVWIPGVGWGYIKADLEAAAWRLYTGARSDRQWMALVSRKGSSQELGVSGVMHLHRVPYFDFAGQFFYREDDLDA